MKMAPIAEVKARFSSYVRASEDGPVVVSRNGKPVAVLLSVADEDELERLLLAHSPRFQALLGAAEQRIRDTGGLTHEDFWEAVESQPPGPPEGE